MKIAAYGLTDVGLKRTRNEDSFLINEKFNLYILADGMGGHSGGEFASQMSVSSVEETIVGMGNDPDATVISGVNTDEANWGDRLRYAVQLASNKIYERALYDSTLKGMGTTTVAVVFQDGYAYIANVGDSRAYLLHANKLSQLTVDHSLVSEQLQAGVITKSDAKKHRFKNIITRSVGYQEDVEIDIKKLEVHMGDKILLCSDGLSNMLEDSEMETILKSQESKEACKSLVKAANTKGGDDNITAMILEVLDTTDKN